LILRMETSAGYAGVAELQSNYHEGVHERARNRPGICPQRAPKIP